MTVLLGGAPAIIGPSEVGRWMAARGAPGAAMLVDFAGGQVGIRDAAGAPRWGSVGGDLAFARASSAGRWPAAGGYEMVGSGVLRYDHDPVTRTPLGVRIESYLSAITTSTVAFTLGDTDWTSGFFAENVVPVTSAFNGGGAAKHICHVGGSQARYQTVTMTAGQSYRLDVILERLPDQAPYSTFGLLAGSWLGLLFYNWANGSMTVPQGAATDIIVEQLGSGPNGGQMVRLSAVINAGEHASALVYVYPNGSSGAVTGQECILHYACASTGALHSSPRIVPVGSLQARAADNLSMVSPVALADGFTVAAAARRPVSQNSGDENSLLIWTPASGIADRFSIGRSSNQLTIYNYVANAYRGHLTLGGSTTLTPDQPFRLAVSWSAARGLRGTLLGGAVASAALASPPATTLEKLGIGNRHGLAPWNSTVERAALWPHDNFTDDQLRGLLA